MTTATRTDIHRPSASEFDPQAYELVGVFGSDPDSVRRRDEIVEDLYGQDYSIGHGSPHQCGHCGTHIVYSALLVRDDAQQFIFVGEQCLSNRFASLTKDEFQRLRELAKLNRDRESRGERLAKLLAEHECLRRLTGGDPLVQSNYFLADIARKLDRDARLSDRQIAAVASCFVREDAKAKREKERAAEKSALIAAGVKAPAGRVEVKGEVVSVKDHFGRFGSTTKLTVKSAEGWLCWVTLPAGVDSDCKGKQVSFTATLEPSDRDPTFAFAKRPTNGKLIS